MITGTLAGRRHDADEDDHQNDDADDAGHGDTASPTPQRPFPAFGDTLTRRTPLVHCSRISAAP